MVGMGLRTSQLLPPFIIFSGVFYKTLIKKAQNLLNYHNNLVTFTDKKWHTEETTMIWLTFVRQTFSVKVIRICYDYALSHTN